MSEAAILVVWGVVVHLFVDWLLQNEWMAVNKVSLKHTAAWVHSGLHFIGALLVFPLPFALVVGTAHLLIDTRKPLIWWRKFYRQTVMPEMPKVKMNEGGEEAKPLSVEATYKLATQISLAVHVAIWGDQVAHIAVIALVALAVAA